MKMTTFCRPGWSSEPPGPPGEPNRRKIRGFEIETLQQEKRTVVKYEGLESKP